MKLQPIRTAPKDGRYILLFGPSGYGTTPLRCQVCRYDPEYHPFQPWVTHANNSFLDSGAEPCYWMPLPTPTAGESLPQDAAMLEEAAKRIALALRCKIHNIADDSTAGGRNHPANAKWLEEVTKGDIAEILRELRHTTWKQAPHEVLKDSFPVVLYFGTEADRIGFLALAREAMPEAQSFKL